MIFFIIIQINPLIQSRKIYHRRATLQPQMRKWSLMMSLTTSMIKPETRTLRWKTIETENQQWMNTLDRSCNNSLLSENEKGAHAP